MPELKVFRNEKGQIVGNLYPDMIYRKEITSKHFMHKFGNGIGIDESIIKELKALGCKEVRVINKDNLNIYHTTLENLENGIPVNFEGRQRILPIDKWEKEDRNNLKLI